ncbi:hypothetical protein IQ07DRAFT_584890 [Pyrenochaeta sp. DS3sAY3a]|nr:hypothetical protein IQ07DRAFT_584890 [Pyrenochaeta sp. DS3sAY3a]
MEFRRQVCILYWTCISQKSLLTSPCSLVREFDTPNLSWGIVASEDISNGNQLLTSPGQPQVQDQASPAASQTWFDNYRSVPEPTDQPGHSNPSSRDEVDTMIGYVHKSTNPDSVFFKCSHSSCKDTTFGRLYEVRRHYWSVHKTREEDFWCSAPGCKRSEAMGGKAFPRKDKLAEHVQKMHGR